MNINWSSDFSVNAPMPTVSLVIPPPPEHAPDEQLIDFSAIVGYGMWINQLAPAHVEQVLRCGRAYLRKWHPTDPQLQGESV